MVKTLQEKFKITEEEKELIIERCADRFRDYVFMAAEEMTQRMVIPLWNEPYDPNVEITLNYRVSQLVADMVVILGAHRRKIHG
ncbi:hypothetical protein LCGC14_2379820 [marine sediment metagenome]|uniref:Uncharacterized protein n=1 Tax=marine sediment metagenome TaxID=412755 RepID=A0A0F9CNF0_9ZZZZ